MLPIPLYKSAIRTSHNTNSMKVLRTVFDDTGETARSLFSEKDTSQKFFGSVPAEFLQAIEPQNRTKVALKLKKALAKFALAVNKSEKQIENQANEQLISYKTKRALITATSNENASNLRLKLSKLLNQAVKVDILGEGQYGKVYKLEIGGKEFVIKTFFDTKEKEVSHGGIIEPQTIQFLQKVTNSGILARCFFGKISPFKGDDAYIVSKFISQNDKAKIKNYGLLTAANPVHWQDATFDYHGDNVNQINGIIIDIGGAQLKKYYPNDKGTSKIIRLLCEIIDKEDKEAFQAFLKKHSNNPKLETAIKYLIQNAKDDYVFNDELLNNNFSKVQKEMLAQLGILNNPTTITTSTTILGKLKTSISLLINIIKPKI